MCWFLTVAVAPVSPMPQSERGWLNVSACQATGFPDGWATFAVSAGMCACGLYAPPGETTSLQGDTSARLRETYQRKGWSAAKIERALRDAVAGQARKADKAQAPYRFREWVVKWVCTHGQMGILAHWEGRSDEGDHQRALRGMTMSAENFLRDGFPPETVVRLHGAPKGPRHVNNLDP